MEAGLVVDYAMASELPKLKELFVGVDESSKVDGRSFVEVEFRGFCEEPFSTTTQRAKTAVEPVATKVSWPVVVKEVLGHTAQQLCNLIEKCLSDTQIVFDLTSTNTGIIGGLGVLLRKKRVEAWQKEHGAGSYPPTELEIKGCDDHIASLISQCFLEKMEQRLALWTKCSGPSVCNSQTVINNGNGMPMQFSRTGSREKTTTTNHQWLLHFQQGSSHIYSTGNRDKFFKLHSQDTDAETAKLLFQVLSNPLVTRVLHVMMWSLRWLKQLMVVEPYVSSNSKTNGMGSSGMPHDVLAFYLAQDWCDSAVIQATTAITTTAQQAVANFATATTAATVTVTIAVTITTTIAVAVAVTIAIAITATTTVAVTVTATTSEIYLWNQLLSVSEVQLADSMYLFSNQFKLCNKARCCINTAITRKVRDAHHLKQSVAKLNKKVASQQQQQKAQEAEKDVVDYLHHINFLPSGSKLTVAYLKKFLHSKREDPRWTLSVKISTTRPFLLADVRTFIELERSHCAATNTGKVAVSLNSALLHQKLY
ncbi:Trichohyalin [Balamuthia mandrillaris]